MRGLNVGVQQIFQTLLPPRHREDVGVVANHMSSQSVQRHFAGHQVLSKWGGPTRIAGFFQLFQLVILNHLLCNQQSAGRDVHASNVTVEQVFGVDGMAAHFGIKVWVKSGACSTF